MSVDLACVIMDRRIHHTALIRSWFSMFEKSRDGVLVEASALRLLLEDIVDEWFERLGECLRACILQLPVRQVFMNQC